MKLEKQNLNKGADDWAPHVSGSPAPSSPAPRPGRGHGHERHRGGGVPRRRGPPGGAAALARGQGGPPAPGRAAVARGLA